MTKNFYPIHGARGRAPKCSGTGFIEYSLWIDDSGNLYIQLNGNTESGTHSSSLLFSVKEYLPTRENSEKISKPSGYDIQSKIPKESKNNNDPGFLKSALNHLIPTDDESNQSNNSNIFKHPIPIL